MLRIPAAVAEFVFGSNTQFTANGSPSAGPRPVQANHTFFRAIGPAPVRLGSNDATALNDANQHYGDRENQEDVNEPTQRVRTHHPEQPQDDEENENRGQH
jgi:hypothetical protein